MKKGVSKGKEERGRGVRTQRTFAQFTHVSSLAIVPPPPSHPSPLSSTAAVILLRSPIQPKASSASASPPSPSFSSRLARTHSVISNFGFSSPAPDLLASISGAVGGVQLSGPCEID